MSNQVTSRMCDNHSAGYQLAGNQEASKHQNRILKHTMKHHLCETENIKLCRKAQKLVLSFVCLETAVKHK